MILPAHVGQLGVDVRSARAVHIGGHGGIVALLVCVVGGRILLLLQGNGQAQIAIFLAEARIVEAGHCSGVAVGDADAAAIVHVHIVGVGGFGFFAHGGGMDWFCVRLRW